MSTSDDPAEYRRLPSRRLEVQSFLGWVAIFAAMVLLGLQFDLPPYIERISIDNPTKFDMYISVRNGEGGGWMPVGNAAHRESLTVVENVIDQGAVWIFRFRAQGEDGGELKLRRADLSGNNWRFRIPERVNEQLLENGASFPP